MRQDTGSARPWPPATRPDQHRPRCINATARAKTTSIAAGSATLFISTFVVTSGQVQITVSSSSESRQDQQVETAAVAIAERLHA